ncbi:hypothetical protein J6590_076843 [Homalodisca vitripennis]|nr:hypothetical protein J6590_076843 [Homalodisca vitripennis]
MDEDSFSVVSDQSSILAYSGDEWVPSDSEQEESTAGEATAERLILNNMAARAVALHPRSSLRPCRAYCSDLLYTPLTDHFVLLIKAIAKKYFKLRLHHFSKKFNESIHKNKLHNVHGAMVIYSTSVAYPSSTLFNHVFTKMYSSSKESDNNDFNKIEKIDRALFVRLLSDHSVLLSKSKTPAVVNAKKEAWETLRSDYCQLIKALNNVKSTVKKKTDVKVTGNRKIKLQPWEKTFLELIEDDNPVFHKIPGNISVGTSAGPPVQQPTSDDIQESLPNTETEGKPNKNEEPKSQETKKPMKTKSDADHHKNKIRKSEKMVSNHEADETKDLSTPQLQRIVLLQQYKLNKIKLEKETILLETMKKQTIEKSTQTDVTVDDCHTLFTL